MGRRTIFTMLAALVGCAVLLGSAWGAEVPRMGIDELKQRLGEADVVVIDTRLAGDATRSQGKIEGSRWQDPNEVEAWAGEYPKAKVLVLYCA